MIMINLIKLLKILAGDGSVDIKKADGSTLDDVGHEGKEQFEWESQVPALCAGLKRNSSLESLDASANSLGPAGGEALADAVKAHISLTCLHVFLNSMGPEGGKLLADAIKAHPNYAQIAMSMFDGKTDVDMSKKKGLDAGDGHIIAAVLESNSTVDSIIIGSRDKLTMRVMPVVEKKSSRKKWWSGR